MSGFWERMGMTTKAPATGNALKAGPAPVPRIPLHLADGGTRERIVEQMQHTGGNQAVGTAIEPANDDRGFLGGLWDATIGAVDMSSDLLSGIGTAARHGSLLPGASSLAGAARSSRVGRGLMDAGEMTKPMERMFGAVFPDDVGGGGLGKTVKGLGKFADAYGIFKGGRDMLDSSKSTDDRVMGGLDAGASGAGFLGPVGSAFSFGWSTGRTLDEGLGLSDKISDGLVAGENLVSTVNMPMKGMVWHAFRGMVGTRPSWWVKSGQAEGPDDTFDLDDAKRNFDDKFGRGSAEKEMAR